MKTEEFEKKRCRKAVPPHKTEIGGVVMVNSSYIAKTLNLSERTVHRWREKGLPHIKITGKVYYEEEAVLQFMQQNERRYNP